MKERVRSCMKRRLGDKKYRTKLLDDMFSMHYGDPAIETFYALNSQDLKRLAALNECVISEDITKHQAR